MEQTSMVGEGMSASTNFDRLDTNLITSRDVASSRIELQLDIAIVQPLATRLLALEAKQIARLVLMGPTNADRVTLELETNPDVGGYGSTWNVVDGEIMCYIGRRHLRGLIGECQYYLEHGRGSIFQFDYYMVGRDGLKERHFPVSCAEFEPMRSIDISGLSEAEIDRLLARDPSDWNEV
ncbi:MAG: hypothetical protein ABIQ99_08150 [Thermoflexales bacterium]